MSVNKLHLSAHLENLSAGLFTNITCGCHSNTEAYSARFVLMMVILGDYGWQEGMGGVSSCAYLCIFLVLVCLTKVKV